MSSISSAANASFVGSSETGGLMSEQTSKIVVGIVALACVSRLAVPAFLGHANNIAPMTAIALLCGARLRSSIAAFLLPLVAIFISDVLVNTALYGGLSPFYSGWYWQYGCYAGIALIGRLLQREGRPALVLGSGLVSTILFFAITNVGVWLTTGLYEQSAAGLSLCFAMALPFLKASIVSDLVFTAVLFAAYDYAYGKLLPRKASAAFGLNAAARV